MMIDSNEKRRRRRRAGWAAVAAASLAVGGLGGSAAAFAGTSPSAPKDDPKRIVYVEVNDNDMANVADYTLEGTQRPAFDIAMIFAANVNYDTAARSAYLHLNERVTETLRDAENQIRPLQERGTKVLLSVLGNHQGAGIANFPTREAAAAFADELAAVVEQYGLDGIDFDDEWSKYGENGTVPANAFSFVYLVDELRARLGDDKLITFYKIGEAAQATEYDGIRAGDLLDYAWNPWYGTWRVPTVAGMDASQLAPGAIDLSATRQSTAAAFAQRTAAEKYGAIITYNLTSRDQSGYLSSITVPLTGLRTVYKAPRTWSTSTTGSSTTCSARRPDTATRRAPGSGRPTGTPGSSPRSPGEDGRRSPRRTRSGCAACRSRCGRTTRRRRASTRSSPASGSPCGPWRSARGTPAPL